MLLVAWRRLLSSCSQGSPPHSRPEGSGVDDAEPLSPFEASLMSAAQTSSYQLACNLLLVVQAVVIELSAGAIQSSASRACLDSLRSRLMPVILSAFTHKYKAVREEAAVTLASFINGEARSPWAPSTAGGGGKNQDDGMVVDDAASAGNRASWIAGVIDRVLVMVAAEKGSKDKPLAVETALVLTHTLMETADSSLFAPHVMRLLPVVLQGTGAL